MADEVNARQGTPALIIPKTLEAPGPLRGYGVARRNELTRAGCRRLTKEADDREQTSAAPARFFAPAEES